MDTRFALVSRDNSNVAATQRENTRPARQYVRREPQDWGWSQDAFSWGSARPTWQDRYARRRYVEEPQFFGGRRRASEPSPFFFQWR